MKLIALPGFLGTPADFAVFLSEFEKQSAQSWDMQVAAISTDIEYAPGIGWANWSQAHLEKLRRWKGGDRLIGVGYSLGGRLLLSIAALDPLLFDALIFISVNPGLSDNQERYNRMKSDQAWADKFEREAWATVVKEWNEQPVFRGGKQEPERREEDYNRMTLGKILRDFSLALQPDFSDEISRWGIPQLWVAGEKDTKFKNMVASLHRLATYARAPFAIEVIEKSGHRVILDEPETAAKRVAEWIKTLPLEPRRRHEK